MRVTRKCLECGLHGVVRRLNEEEVASPEPPSYQRVFTVECPNGHICHYEVEIQIE